MYSKTSYRYSVRRLEYGDVAAVRHAITEALKKKAKRGGCPSALKFDCSLELGSGAEITWVLWKNCSPIALLHMNPAHQYAGGFESIAWLGEAPPQESVQIRLMLGARKVVQCTAAEFCEKFDLRWYPSTGADHHTPSTVLV